MPVVTMIMPAFNSETTIQASIDSVVNQSFRNCLRSSLNFDILLQKGNYDD